MAKHDPVGKFPMNNRKLIRANLAIARGERAEAERLLRQMKATGQASDPEQRALMLWLDAQAQHDRETRVRKLYELINSVGHDDPYGQLARDYLQEEAAYAEAENEDDGLKFFGMAWWKAALFAVAALVSIGLLISALTPRTDPTAEVAQVENTAAPQATLPPDRSRPLVPEGFSVRYDKGILQVAAIEDDSARVISPEGIALTPVEGARFYALNIFFECREGICENPPEADIRLRLDDGGLIEPEPNALIAGEPVLAPIALGRTTQGWTVFEIPVINGAESLVISPILSAPNRTTPEPLTIRLEGS